MNWGNQLLQLHTYTLYTVIPSYYLLFDSILAKKVQTKNMCFKYKSFQNWYVERTIKLQIWKNALKLDFKAF
jgi:hypothetical protein